MNLLLTKTTSLMLNSQGSWKPYMCKVNDSNSLACPSIYRTMNLETYQPQQLENSLISRAQKIYAIFD